MESFLPIGVISILNWVRSTLQEVSMTYVTLQISARFLGIEARRMPLQPRVAHVLIYLCQH